MQPTGAQHVQVAQPQQGIAPGIDGREGTAHKQHQKGHIIHEGKQKHRPLLNKLDFPHPGKAHAHRGDGDGKPRAKHQQAKQFHRDFEGLFSVEEIAVQGRARKRCAAFAQPALVHAAAQAAHTEEDGKQQQNEYKKHHRDAGRQVLSEHGREGAVHFLRTEGLRVGLVCQGKAALGTCQLIHRSTLFHLPCQSGQGQLEGLSLTRGKFARFIHLHAGVARLAFLDAQKGQHAAHRPQTDPHVLISRQIQHQLVTYLGEDKATLRPVDDLPLLKAQGGDDIALFIPHLHLVKAIQRQLAVDQGGGAHLLQGIVGADPGHIAFGEVLPRQVVPEAFVLLPLGREGALALQHALPQGVGNDGELQVVVAEQRLLKAQFLKKGFDVAVAFLKRHIRLAEGGEGHAQGGLRQRVLIAGARRIKEAVLILKRPDNGVASFAKAGIAFQSQRFQRQQEQQQSQQHCACPLHLIYPPMIPQAKTTFLLVRDRSLIPPGKG